MREKLKLRFIVDIDAEYEKKITADADFDKKKLEMIIQFFNRMLDNKPLLIEYIKENFLSFLQLGENYTEVLSELLPDRTKEIGLSIVQTMPPETRDFINYVLTADVFKDEIADEKLIKYRDAVTNQFDEPEIIKAWFTERPNEC